MDSTLLRLILLVIGLLILVGIYFWETRRQKQKSPQAERREPPELSAAQLQYPQAETGADWDLRDTEPDNVDAELDRLSLELDETKSDRHSELKFGVEKGLPEELMEEQQELFGFSAQEESPVDVPHKIIQINLKTKGDPFSGPAIEKAVKEVGLQPGDMQIYHRFTPGGNRKALFNMASMVEPGVFPLKKMEGFSTPGLTLFTQLPGAGDGLVIFSDMLFTAERLAAILGGVLQDETHSTLTKQTIETLRSQIVEHRRQIQLARSRR